MKHWFAASLVLLFISCQSGPGLIPVDSSQSLDSGQFVEVDLQSPMVKDNFEFLQEYLEEHMEKVLPLQLSQAFVRVDRGHQLVLICSYKDSNKDTWLKATLKIDEEGLVYGKEILTSYKIDLLESEF